MLEGKLAIHLIAFIIALSLKMVTLMLFKL